MPHIKTLFRSTRSPVIAGVGSELERLKGFVAERGSEVGLLNLPPEHSVEIIEAQIYLIAEKRFGPTGLPNESYGKLEARLRNERAQIESKLDTHQAQQIAQPALPTSPNPSKPIRWITPIGNAIVIFALLGLALEACGIKLAKSGYAALTLCAAFVLLNLTNGPTVVRNSLSWIGYALARFRHYLTGRRLRIKAKRLDRRIEKITQQREAEAVRRYFVVEWIAQTRKEILNHFEFSRTRAAEAARLIPDEDQRIASLLESDRVTFERDGTQARAPHPDSQKQRSAAFSGLFTQCATSPCDGKHNNHQI